MTLNCASVSWASFVGLPRYPDPIFALARQELPKGSMLSVGVMCMELTGWPEW